MTVTDGELNVFVQATSRSKAGDDPIVNYIIVKAIPGSEADALAVLKVTVQKYLEKVAGKDYTTTTKAAFDQAIADAQKLIDENSADTDAIAAAKKAIEKAYSSLVEAHLRPMIPSQVPMQQESTITTVQRFRLMADRSRRSVILTTGSVKTEPTVTDRCRVYICTPPKICTTGKTKALF